MVEAGADVGGSGPLLFRSMRAAADGLPAIGPLARNLGVRTDQDPRQRYFDIHVDPGTGLVEPGTGGLSVSPDRPDNLPHHRLPLALGGGGDDPVFAIQQGALGPDLDYRPDPRRPTVHGFIEPSRLMDISEYQSALAETRDRWVRYHP